jgi:predicted phage terminase large subunit-like protein
VSTPATQLKLSPSDLQKLRTALPTMPDREKRRVAELLTQYQKDFTRQTAKDSFLDFIAHVYPGYIVGPHHRRLAKIFEDIANGVKKRVIVNIAPRMGKSELISYLAPAWYLGRNPHKKVIMSSHTAELAVNFGRRVKNLVGSDSFKDIFPQVELQADSKASGRWGTNFQGEYFAIGVGGALAGRGADLFIIDDPHSEQEAKTGRAEVFLPAFQWFQSGPLQRLMPQGAIIIVMCMTGDTPVLMANGTEKPLRDVRPGDRVATYEDGGFTTAQVLNHRSNGVDEVCTVQTQSGRMLRANERHPFLVDFDGDQRWVRLRDLQPGMCLVARKDVTAPHGLRFDRDSAPLALRPRHTIASTLMRLITRWGTMGNGKENRALSAAIPQQSRGYAAPVTLNSIFHHRPQPSSAAPSASSPVMASPLNNTTRWWQHATTVAMSAANDLLSRTLALIGMVSCASTTAMTQARYADCSAMTATSQLGTVKPPRFSRSRPSTCAVTVDPIISVTPSGREEVFDLQVERTENFIANGVVSHNTRWSKLDLTGQLVKQMVMDEGVDQWEVVEFPAILNEKSLWPEFWPLEELLAKKAGMDPRYWAAQYDQNPVSEEGALIKEGWWQVWERESPPTCEFIIMSLDTAQETNNRADYTALQVWGVFYNEKTENNNIILLNAIKKRLEFPDLKELVYAEYRSWQPDAFIVEKKSSGSALYQEMRRSGVPVGEFTPGKGTDKISRVNSVTDLFRSGVVWAPDLRWAKEVIQECQDFPSGENDDQVDAMTLALMRFRQGGFIRIPGDEPEPEQYFKSNRNRGYY